MKPYIVCHMAESLDGRIDCEMTEKIEAGYQYYRTLDLLNCDSMLSGKITSVLHYALPGTFTSKGEPIGKPTWHKAMDAPGFDIIADTRGTLMYDDNMNGKRNMLILTSELATGDYLDYLAEKGISYLCVGTDAIDLHKAVEMLSEHFGVKRLGVVGGGTINGAFLRAGLLDEISMLIAPGIDGRKGMVGSFDGADMDVEPTLLKLESVERRDEEVWLRYSIKN